MSKPTAPKEKPDYGIDAPDVVRRFLSFGTVLVVIYFATPSITGLFPLWLAMSLHRLAPGLGMIGYLFVATSMVMLWGSRSGKLRLRDRLLSRLSWRGDEQVLDVGCGHGLMLIGAAQRLDSGRAVGVDIWLDADQSRNRPEATLRNARIEQLGERVEVRSADARELPFDAGSFDLVLSSWMLHRLGEQEQRQRALQEMVRVLKPGGRILLVDIRHGREYAAYLRALGFVRIHVGLPNFLFVTPTLAVIAQKPLQTTLIEESEP